MEGEEAYSNVLSASEAWNLLVDYIGECLDMDTLQAIFESCKTCLEISMEAALTEVQLRYCLEDPLVEPEHEFQTTLKDDKKDIAADIPEVDEAFPPLHKYKETIERAVSECDGDEELSMQFLLDRTYLSACTRTQLLPQSQPIKTNPNPIQSSFVDIMDNNCGGPSLPLPSHISPPLPSRLRKSNITSHAAAKLRVEASHEVEKMKLFHRKMVREMKAYPGAGEISRQEGKACRLRMVSLHSRAAAIMLQATNRGLSFNSSSITEGDNEELKLSHLQLAAWNLTDGGALVCDLHGLTIEEAKTSIDIVLNGSGFYLKRKQMASSRSRPNPTLWIFITGVGNHSKGGKPILTPAVKRHLTRSLGLNTVEHLPGVLQVTK